MFHDFYGGYATDAPDKNQPVQWNHFNCVFVHFNLIILIILKVEL